MTTTTPVLRRALREGGRGALGWGIAVVGVLMLYLPLYPSIGANGQMQEIIETLPEGMVNALGYDQIGTGAGYAQATFYGLIGFFILTAAAVGWCSDAIAGAEENGRLELDLAHGVGRQGYLYQAAAGVLLRLVLLAVIAGAVVLGLNSPAQLEIETIHVLGASLALLGLTALSGSLALLVGALSGRRTWALGAGAGIAVLSYAVNAVANQSPDLDWLHTLSPYSWAYRTPPLSEGVAAGGLIALWVGVAVLTAAAAVALRRRDVVG